MLGRELVAVAKRLNFEFAGFDLGEGDITHRMAVQRAVHKMDWLDALKVQE